MVKVEGQREEFGEVVKRWREARNMSQERLAALANLSPGYISLIETGERGKRPGRDTVLSLAQALKVPAADLLRAAGRLSDTDAISPETGRPTFEEFVATDPELRSDQKKILVDLYRSWVRSTD